MHDPIHTLLDTLLTKKGPIKKFKKIRNRENREIKRMKDRKAREAAGGGHDTDEKFNVPYGRPGLSGAPAASRDYGLAERLSQQRGLVPPGSKPPRGSASNFNYQPGLPPLRPASYIGRTPQPFSFPFPGQLSQEPPRRHSASPTPSNTRPSQKRERAVTAPSGQKSNPGMVGLTEYENQSVVPRTYPKVTETKREKSSSSKAKNKEKSGKKEKKDKKEKEKEPEKEEEPSHYPMSHYPMSDGASLKTELNRGIGDMRRSFVEGFLPSISDKSKKSKK